MEVTRCLSSFLAVCHKHSESSRSSIPGLCSNSSPGRAVLELTILTRLTSVSQRSSCFCLSAGTEGVFYNTGLANDWALLSTWGIAEAIIFTAIPDQSGGFPYLGPDSGASLTMCSNLHLSGHKASWVLADAGKEGRGGALCDSCPRLGINRMWC